MPRGGFSTEIEVTGLEDARKVIAGLAQLGQDLTPILALVGRVLVDSTKKRFGSGRGPGGVPWAPTKRQRSSAVGKRGPNKAAILVDTGDLRGSIKSVVRPTEVEVGSDGLKNPVKAIANQFGSHRQTVVLRHLRTINSVFGVPLPAPITQTVRAHGRVTNLPARPFLGVDEEDRSEIMRGVIEYLGKAFPK